MPRIPFVLILVATAVLAQKPPQQTTPKPPVAVLSAKKFTGKVVAPTDPVITIQGLCTASPESKPATGAGACRAVVSRKDFESFLKALGATTRGVEPSLYYKVAQNYFSLLAYAELAQSAGVDKDSRFEQVLEATRLRALGDMFRVKVTEKALHIPDQEIAAYYEKNIADYEEVDLDRFQVPKNNMANLSDVDFRIKAKQLAEDLHARALKGEAIAKLQKEALNALGLKDSLVIEIGLRRGQFKEQDEKVIFALKQGEVTPVLDGGGVWIFFKRTSRETLTFEQVKSEIRGTLYRDKTDGLEKALHDAVHVEYNDAYFATSPTAQNNAANTGNSTTKREVAPGDAVITIHGLCGNQKPETGSCTRVITREQFEPLLKMAILNAMTPTSAIPRSIAEGYVDDLIYADAAEKAGLDKDPRFPGVMKLVRQRALGDLYHLTLDEKAHAIPPQEIETYYAKNSSAFEELTLTHISVPRQKSRKARDADFDAKAKGLAGELHERALKGEDMEKLQREVYQVLGLPNPYADYEAVGTKTPPLSSMQPIRRGSMEQMTEAELFQLKKGQISSVREFPTAYVIYKLENRRTIPLQEVTPEISNKLYQQNLATVMKPLASVQARYNERYFSRRGGEPISAAQSGAAQKAMAHR
ncbi:MAG TPA: peptidylprolyl isomerase [Verrucomicrobiae bacterium]|nr:peptidylprolyl isomerase [Verrucomicrobiae bacterium]